MKSTTRSTKNGNSNGSKIRNVMEKIQKALNESAVARWTVLVLVASMMFFAYMFVDILSPLASLLEKTPHLGWNQGVFGTYAAGEYLLNVFGFLILAVRSFHF